MQKRKTAAVHKARRNHGRNLCAINQQFSENFSEAGASSLVKSCLCSIVDGQEKWPWEF
jgi:hypothetical protein